MWRRLRGNCQLHTSGEILDELQDKLHEKFGFSPKHTRLMTLFVKRQTQIVEVSSTLAVCRDPDDDRVLAAALDAGCSHLVTGDSDLLALKQFRGVAIVTPRQFMEAVSAA